MNREEFDKLELLYQVEYINNQLENNNSVTSVCKQLKIGRSTIRDRFKKIGYNYSKDLKKYLYNESITDVYQDGENLNNGCITTDIQTKNNNSTTGVIQEDVMTEVLNKSDGEIKKTLLDIVNNYDVLKEIIELHKSNTSVVKQQITIDLEESESKLTTIRVNAREMELFNKFCDENKQYRKIDLISQALKEFREKYK
mgnify:CR=1 FL=1